MTAGPIHIHVAEQVKEVEDCVAWCGARPVELLLDRAPVDRRWCLVHATHMTPDETRRLAASGAVAGLCPITEANLGDGLFPAPDYLAAGGAFGVGSDSNVLIDAAQELRLLEYGQRLAQRARNIFAESGGDSTGAALYRGALKGGARALGAETGRGLREGQPADLFSLAAEGGAGDRHLDRWIFAGARPQEVWRAGRKMVTGGEHVARRQVAARYRAVLAKLTAA
jgi:formiminoglutamate deiminase